MTENPIRRITQILCFFLFLALGSCFVPAEEIQNVFRPGEVWNDTDGKPINAHGGGILFYEGRYYWFGEHKIAGEAGNSAMVGVHCYSSTDLFRWKNEGVVLAVSDDPESDITRGCILERPKVLRSEKTGKFVMWFHLELKSTGYKSARSGVAVADSVTGPYRYVGSMRPCAGHWPQNVSDAERQLLGEDEIQAIADLKLGGGPHPNYPADRIFRRDFTGGQMARDMTLFRDDDGASYHLYSSEENGVLHIAELSDDLLSHSGKYVRVFPGRFHEAPAIMKCKGKYWLIASGCTGWAPNAARLAVADSIWGPWRELDNPCRGTDEEREKTFQSQSTFLLKVEGKDDHWIFMADRWNPKNAIDGRYVWLPVEFDGDVPFLRWHESWSLDLFPTPADLRE